MNKLFKKKFVSVLFKIIVLIGMQNSLAWNIIIFCLQFYYIGQW